MHTYNKPFFIVRHRFYLNKKVVRKNEFSPPHGSG